MAYSAEKGKREDFPGSSWSDWILIMSPTAKQGFSPRINHPGFRSESSGWGIPNGYGIYELAIESNAQGNQRLAVVFIGSACRDIDANISMRIDDYCRDGSHEVDFIDKALRENTHGYNIYARYKITYPPNNRTAAENAENCKLRSYDYAWNKRQNGETRLINP